MITYLVVDKKSPEYTTYVDIDQLKGILALRNPANIEVFVGVKGSCEDSILVEKSDYTNYLSSVLATKTALEYKLRKSGQMVWR